jgi:insecticidal toxin complex protein TccC
MDLHRHTPTLTVHDPRGLAVRTVAYNRIAADDEAQAHVTQQVHDTLGRAVATRDPRLFALWELDSTVPANQSAVVSLSGMPLRTYSVDAGCRVGLFGEAGQALESWDGRASHRRMSYDEMLRPKAITEQEANGSPQVIERFGYGDSSAASAEHNQCGQLIRHDDAAGSRHFSDYGMGAELLRDNRQFLAQWGTPDWPLDVSARDALLEPEGYSTAWTYDAQGETLSQTDARGNTQSFAYTVAGQLKDIQLRLADGTEQTLVSEMVYNAFGQVEAETAGNGVLSHAQYDPADGRLRRLTAHRPGRTALQDLAYSYDPVGNVTQVEDGTQSVRYFANQRLDGLSTYAYDALYQLIEATGREAAGAAIGPDLPAWMPLPGDGGQMGNYVQTYRYDTGSNLVELRHAGRWQSYTRAMAVAPHSNRALSGDEDDAPAFGAGFDANGNLQALQPGQGLRWDARNQLQRTVQVVRQEGADDDECYVYDGAGARIRKRRRSQAARVTHEAEVRYLPGLELRTDTATGEVLQVMTVQAGRGRVSCLHWEQHKPAAATNDHLRYSLDDHLGSSTLELDQQADLLSHEGYYPYGGSAWWAAVSEIEVTYKTLRYSGKERDASGLYYYGLRYYAPWLQRWINPDPAGATDGLNLYRMARNNPMTYVDDDGAKSKDRNTHIFRLATFLFRKEGEGMTSSMKRGQKIARTIIGGLFIGGLVASAAVTAGASIGVIAAVAAIGFGVGAALGYNTNRMTEAVAGRARDLLKGKSKTAHTMAGAGVATFAATVNGARPQGIVTAAAAGAVAGFAGGVIDNADRGMGGANASGTAVGTVDLLAGTDVSTAMEVSAAVWGGVGGFITGVEGSANVGENAGYGAYVGGMAGRYMDNAASYTFNYVGGEAVKAVFQSYAGAYVPSWISNRVVDSAVGSVTDGTGPAGPAEWTASMAGAAVGGVGTALIQTVPDQRAREWLEYGAQGINAAGGYVMDLISGNVIMNSSQALAKEAVKRTAKAAISFA